MGCDQVGEDGMKNNIKKLTVKDIKDKLGKAPLEWWNFFNDYEK